MDTYDSISQWDLGPESKYSQEYQFEGKKITYGRILHSKTKNWREIGNLCIFLNFDSRVIIIFWKDLLIFSWLFFAWLVLTSAEFSFWLNWAGLKLELYEVFYFCLYFFIFLDPSSEKRLTKFQQIFPEFSFVQYIFSPSFSDLYFEKLIFLNYHLDLNFKGFADGNLKSDIKFVDYDRSLQQLNIIPQYCSSNKRLDTSHCRLFVSKSHWLFFPISETFLFSCLLMNVGNSGDLQSVLSKFFLFLRYFQYIYRFFLHLNLPLA